MRKKQSSAPNIPTNRKHVFGFVLFALLLVAVFFLLSSSSLTGQIGISLRQLPLAPNAQQSDPTPGAGVRLPLISQGNPPDWSAVDFNPEDIIKQASIVIKAEKEWETYVDPSYGYSIQYPKGWYLRPTPVGAAWHGGIAHIATFDPTIEGTEERERELAEHGYVKIDIGVSMTPKLLDESLEEWLARKDGGATAAAASVTERRTVKGSSEQAIVQVFAPDTLSSISTQVVYIPKGDKVFYISIFELPYNSPYHEFIDKILTTFSLEPNF